MLLRLAAALLLLPAAGSAADLGIGVTLTEITPVSAILESPDAYVDRTVAVEGLIVDVCSTRGCWMELAGDKPFQKIRIKVNDGEIVFPLTARGSTAAVQGRVERITMSAEEAIRFHKHQAEEKGIPFDPSAVTGPETWYQIRATGAVIR